MQSVSLLIFNMNENKRIIRNVKLDREGCEYDLILNASDEALQAFDQIIMEYHYGYRNLVKRLRQARFKVKYSLPKYSHDIEAENKNMHVGFMFATCIR